MPHRIVQICAVQRALARRAAALQPMHQLAPRAAKAMVGEDDHVDRLVRGRDDLADGEIDRGVGPEQALPHLGRSLGAHARRGLLAGEEIDERAIVQLATGASKQDEHRG